MLTVNDATLYQILIISIMGVSNIRDDIKKFLEEMDDLTKKGIFGDKPKMHALLKEKIDLNSYFIQIFLDWLKDKRQIGKDNVHKTISLLLQLYFNAIKNNSEKSIEILGYFIDGFPDVNESEIVKHLYTWYESLNTWRNSLPTGKNPGDDYQVAQNSITVYQNGIELVGKILPVITCLRKVSLNQDFDAKNIYQRYLGPKIEEFEESFNDNTEYLFITNLIDKKLRNAVSHLDVRYDRIRKKYICIFSTRNKRETNHIPAKDFLTKYFPNPGYVIQGYIFSLILIVALAQSRIADFGKIATSLK